MFKLTYARATAIYYASLVGVVYALPTISVFWVLTAALTHVVVMSIFSGVTHRYFCHHAYETNKTLAWALSLIPAMYGQPLPMGWAPLHAAHHKFADTDKDTHIKGWMGILTLVYKTPSARFAVFVRWFYDKKHALADDYAIILPLVLVVGLYLISVDTLLWVGVVPIFTIHLSGGLHRVFSHSGTVVINRWYMEYIAPAGGEWIHDEHHINATKVKFRNKWYELDTGYLLVCLIRRRDKRGST